MTALSAFPLRETTGPLGKRQPAGDLGLPAASRSDLRHAIIATHRCAEQPLVLALADEARLDPADLSRATALARELAVSVRKRASRSAGVDPLMREFSPSTRDGGILMALVEALQRIPDTRTRDRLIQDKLTQGNWTSHFLANPSLALNAAVAGLALAKWVLTPSDRDRGSPTPTGGVLALPRSALRKVSAPLIRWAIEHMAQIVGQQFIAAQTVTQALERAASREASGFRFTYDLLGEAAVTQAAAEAYYTACSHAIEAIGKAAAGRGVERGPGLSVKLSALHPRYSLSQRERCFAELLPRLRSLALLAKTWEIGLTLDAEESERLDLSLDLLEALVRDPALAGWNGLGVVVQAYQKRAPAVIDWLIALSREAGRCLMVRLVKGAYWDGEIKKAQVDGLADYPVFTRKAHTDVCYLACAKRLLAAPDAVFPQFATHSAFTIAAVHTLARDASHEFQCLYGMGESIYEPVVRTSGLGVPCRIYAPIGSQRELLAYLVRRLLENGSNSSFVHQVADPTVPLEHLTQDPVAAVAHSAGRPHPGLPLPADLLPGRENSRGLDFGDPGALADLTQAMAATPRSYSCGPLIAATTTTRDSGDPIRNPANTSDLVGMAVPATPATVAAAVGAAQAGAAAWATSSREDRAACLERWADALQADSAALMALAVREAGKTLPNAQGEVREAVDFCRYYASQLRTEFAAQSGEPIGPVACISPWNFPLAIFTGQIAAALAAGNPVLAKPAEQTPLIAARAVALAHAAGIPRAALQLLPGPGETVGATLVAHPGIAGVMFTGSTEVARTLNRVLAKRAGNPVLIAETGGLNTMIVDSSALPEQAIAHIVTSAFDSAGQRCSALRLLCVQEDIAEPFLNMLRGAMQELTVGDPAQLRTDVGPVIDAPARDAIAHHLTAMRAQGYPVFQTALPAECGAGTFVAPALVELPAVTALNREIFGPVLHAVRFATADLETLVEDLNRSGYGLTHGIQTRIDGTAAFIARTIRAGNVYVNRTMIGAVVGVQPFGGEGLSGTGPKAGGPLYLHRLQRGTTPSVLASSLSPGDPSDPRLAQLRSLAEANAGLSAKEREALAKLLADLLPMAGEPLPVALPSPAGETNTWQLRPRGKIACLADSPFALLKQLMVTVATGNRPVVALQQPDGTPPNPRWLRGVERAADPMAEDLQGILADLSPDRLADVRVRAAARDGAIVPVMVPDPARGYPLWRLYVERAICSNTAAAGGNAALMALTESNPGDSETGTSEQSSGIQTNAKA
jgi:RHH-type transcriptional regulator, proline utilization regulon repressor / proline dehydrogenase / delta 1-pyrroline-5-carboxylate dehydrogenase